MPNAARVGDPCYEVQVDAPRTIEGPCAKTVLVENAPAATAGSQVIVGAATILVGDKPLARVNDATITNGIVLDGAESVMVE